MSTLPVEIHGLILDLERRVRLLENGLYGHAAPLADPVLLTRCYFEAHRVAQGINPATASAWVAQAYLWDVRALVTVGRLVSDPFPYRPLLAALDHCVWAEIEGAPQARRHFESICRDLLVAQGLEILDPRDTMASLRLKEALDRLQGLPRGKNQVSHPPGGGGSEGG